MKETTLKTLTNIFSIDEIEKNLIYNFVHENNIDYSHSYYLSKYLSEIEPNEKIMTSIRQLNHKKIEEIVADMELLMPAEDKKTNGAFFTPQYIVDYIISNISPQENAKVVDPSCGSGAFLLGIIRYFIKKFHKSIRSIIKENLYGADILEYNTRRAKLLIILYAIMSGDIINEEDIHIFTTDSLRCSWAHKFDAVVGNPPYVKFQDLDDMTRILLFESYQTTKMGTYNLYFAFFEMGLKLLTKNGRLGYITPNNYFTSLSGEPLRHFFQDNRSIYQIIDFNSTKVFEVQTYTAISFLNKKNNKHIKYDRIERGEAPTDFLCDITLTPNNYTDLSAKKWRLLCGDERKNIQKIENCGQTLGSLMNICVGIATLKDEVFFIDPIKEDKEYYYIKKKHGNFKIEKLITKPLVKISDMKTTSDVKENKRRIIFPYRKIKGKPTVIDENEFKDIYPYCYKYLLSVKNILQGRGKGKHIYTPFYMYGRSQGLNRIGSRIYTPSFSLKPRFLFDNEKEGFFTNGYGLYFKDEDLLTSPIAKIKNVDVLLKIINSRVMDYYVTKTSVAIEGGYPCYQKNFIERFAIPDIKEGQISELRNLTINDEIDKYVCDLYQINLF
ncbi:MAG: HsdM family class I SAM-dependent methyltransferase [Porphyromonadaceae bacterium]